MSYSLSAAACWVVLAAILATIPSNDNHWRRAYMLMAVGAPILVWVYWENGVWVGLACTAAVASVFRPEWLDAVAREHGVMHAPLAEALAAYAG